MDKTAILLRLKERLDDINDAMMTPGQYIHECVDVMTDAVADIIVELEAKRNREDDE
jgi:hypothetical protein